MQGLPGSLHASPVFSLGLHAPAPSHLPSSPQGALEAVHALCATWPATTKRHFPAAPAVNGAPEQALQPVHAMSQHTPSATILDVHSKVCVAGVPLGFLAVQVPVVPLAILQ